MFCDCISPLLINWHTCMRIQFPSVLSLQKKVGFLSPGYHGVRSQEKEYFHGQEYLGRQVRLGGQSTTGLHAVLTRHRLAGSRRSSFPVLCCQQLAVSWALRHVRSPAACCLLPGICVCSQPRRLVCFDKTALSSFISLPSGAVYRPMNENSDFYILFLLSWVSRSTIESFFYKLGKWIVITWPVKVQ